MPEFKIGQKVRISNLDRYHDDPSVAGGMKEYLGTESKIMQFYAKFGTSQRVRLEGNHWSWDTRWLKPAIKVRF